MYVHWLGGRSLDSLLSHGQDTSQIVATAPNSSLVAGLHIHVVSGCSGILYASKLLTLTRRGLSLPSLGASMHLLTDCAMGTDLRHGCLQSADCGFGLIRDLT